MEKSKVILTDSAYRDLDRITDFLIDRNPSAANRIYHELIDAYRKLADFPLMGTVMHDIPLRNENYRRLVVGDYVTIYRFLSGTCIIDHVFHGKENYGALYMGAKQ